MKSGHIKGDRIEDIRMKSDTLKYALKILLDRFCSKSFRKTTASEEFLKDSLGEACRGSKT